MMQDTDFDEPIINDRGRRRYNEEEYFALMATVDFGQDTPYRGMYNINYMQPAVCEHGETPWDCGACAEWRRM